LNFFNFHKIELFNQKSYFLVRKQEKIGKKGVKRLKKEIKSLKKGGKLKLKK
tara:strand:+ start:360 stop:515 length:156 start_codon:yes stop_codon:yes gene_type:complete